MNVEGVAALVTGGASGLGEAVARRLHADGALVVIADRDPERGKATAASIGSTVRFAATDVTDDDQVEAAVDVAAEEAPLRVAVNCAGVGGGVRMLTQEGKVHSRRVWHRIVDVNLFGTFLVMSRAAARMAETDPLPGTADRGVIVNTASIAAFEGQAGQVAYAASKAAVAGMSLPAARDLASVGIRVCAIAPGMMDTPMLAELSEEGRAGLKRDVAHPDRFGQPAEFAALVAATIDNDYLNGTTLRLDGGLRMPPR